jgi:hypothetical protein
MKKGNAELSLHKASAHIVSDSIDFSSLDDLTVNVFSFSSRKPLILGAF